MRPYSLLFQVEGLTSYNVPSLFITISVDRSYDMSQGKHFAGNMHQPASLSKSSQTRYFAMADVWAWLQNTMPDGETVPPSCANSSRTKRHETSFTESQKFDLAFPCVKLPKIEQDARNQRASSDPWFSQFKEPRAWEMICEYAIPSFQVVRQGNVQYATESGLQMLLATLLAACANILGDRVSLRREWEVDGAGYTGPIPFVFLQDELITLIVEVKCSLRDTFEHSVQQVCKQLVAAWHHNFKVTGARGRPVVAFLQDADGGVAFRLEDEATDAFCRESFKGTITCTSYMFAFSGGGELPGIHFKQWIYGIVESACGECASWDDLTWKQKIAAASTRVSNAADNFLMMMDTMDKLRWGA
jgi:hypothetical protein